MRSSPVSSFALRREHTIRHLFSTLLCFNSCFCFFFFNSTATTEIYTLSLHDALPISLFAVLDHGVVVVWVLGGIAGAILYLTLVSVAWKCYRTQIRLEGELYEARVLYETTGRFGDLMDGDALLTAIVEGAVSLTRASYGGTAFPDANDMVMPRRVPP